MSLSIQQSTNSGPALPETPTRPLNRHFIVFAISMLPVDKIFGTSGNIGHYNGWRIDRQNSDGHSVNISIQLDGVGPPSTIASVLIDDRYGRHRPVRERMVNGVDPVVTARERELERIARKGLMDSLNSHRRKTSGISNEWIIFRSIVTGEFSNL